MPGTQFILPPGTAAQPALDAIAPVLADYGWRLVPNPNGAGWWTIERGDASSTILLGALAGDNFLHRFPLGIVPDASGEVSVSVHSEQGVDKYKGGFIGRGKSREAETQLLAQVQYALVKAGLFVEWRSFA